MLCQRCQKNNATIRYAEVVDGQVTDVHLCQGCLERQESATAGFELAGDIPAHRGPAERVEAAPSPSSTQRTCTTCGIQFGEILDTRKVGCSVCYDTFSDELSTVLRKMHPDLHHRGKVPNLDDDRTRLSLEMQRKRALLRTAIKSEDYEQAALLRDSLHELEAQATVTESASHG
jgi:protein arginine kinase activator